MNENFSRIITLLRKERGLSQKQVASDLQISQSLLSHYEKGIRECSLNFVLRISDYYNVSCDYLLGKTLDKNGSKITLDDTTEDNQEIKKENQFNKSILPTLNKKLITNSLNIIFDVLQKINSKSLTNEVSNYIMISIYKMFRAIYLANNKNPKEFFSIPIEFEPGLSSAAQTVAETKVLCITSCKKTDKIKCLTKEQSNNIELSQNILSKKYPNLSSSIYNLIQTVEKEINKN